MIISLTTRPKSVYFEKENNMENNEQGNMPEKSQEELLFDMEVAKITDDLTKLQTQLQNLIYASDGLVLNSPLPLKFFNRVNTGEMVGAFSNLAKTILGHVENLKKATSQVKVETNE